MAASFGSFTISLPASVPALTDAYLASCVSNPSPRYLILRQFSVGQRFSRRSTTIPSLKYVYPDPNPEFAAAETVKFKADLLKKLYTEKAIFGDDLQIVANVCAQKFSKFLHEEYGGPGTLLIEPFTEMMIILKEKKLPGAEIATRASLLWAQNHVDRDWEIWNSSQN